MQSDIVQPPGPDSGYGQYLPPLIGLMDQNYFTNYICIDYLGLVIKPFFQFFVAAYFSFIAGGFQCQNNKIFEKPEKRSCDLCIVGLK